MGVLSFLGAAERQINPFDNGATAKNTKGNGQNKSVASQVGSQAAGLAKGFVAPFSYLGQAALGDPVDVVKQVAALKTGNKTAFDNASAARSKFYSPTKILASGAQGVLDVAAPGVAGIAEKGAVGAFGFLAPKLSERLVTNAALKTSLGLGGDLLPKGLTTAAKLVAGPVSGAAIGGPYNVANLPATGQKLTVDSGTKAFKQGAGAGAVLGTAGEAIPIAAKGAKAGVNHLADTTKIVADTLGNKAETLGENGFLNLSNATNKHPTILALNDKLDELNKKRDQLSSQGATKTALNQNAKAYKATLQAKQNAVRKIVQGGYIGSEETPKPINTEDINQLAKAPDTKAVKQVLDGKVDPATVDKIAPAIENTKDPHVISDIVQKNTPPEIPVDTTQAPSIAPAAPSVEKGIQALSNVAKNSKNFNDFQKNFESLPSHPDLQAAVDTVAPHQTLEEFYNSLTGKTPDTTVAPSITPAEGPKTPQQQIIDALTSQNGEKGAGAIRAKQERGYTAERGKRIGAAQGAGKDLPGTEGYYAELAQLKGELPKEEYTGLSDKLNPKQQEDLFTKLRGEIQQHPDINGYSAINAQGALRKVIFGEGGVPTTSEITLLKNAFGDDFSKAVQEDVSNHNARVSTVRKAYNTAAEVAGVPRAIMASFDFSGGLRQGLAAATRHPVIFAQAFAKQFKNFASENAYKESLDAIENHPNYPLMQRGGLAIQDIGNTVVNPSAREEQFVSGLAEKIPIIGDIVHASGRAYTGLLNDMRANIFNQLIETSKNAGIDFETGANQKLLKQIAEVVNTSTGRGSLGALEGAAKELSTGLFAPRLIASRVQMLNPQYYIKLNPIARKEALTTLLSLGAVATTVLSAAELAGASVNKDPTNADFGKIKIGDTRLDILGGYQQYLRLGAQLATGQSTSSITGANQTLGKGIAATRFDVLTRFLTNKEAPVPSFITTLLKGKDAAGNPVDVPKEVLSRFTPLIGQDIRDLLTHKSSAGPAAALAGVFGVGLQTYGKQDIQPNPKQQTYLDTLKKNGASADTIAAATSFFQSQKVAGGKRQNVSDAINKALGSGNIQKAQQLAQDYNKQYAAGFKDWVKQYGKTATDSQLVKSYNSQKINLTATDIQRRVQAIKDKKAGKL